MHSLQEKNNGEQHQAKIRRKPEVGESHEREGISSNETQKTKNQAKSVRKRKIDHLEWEFKELRQPASTGN